MAENIAVLSPGLADTPPACAVTGAVLGIAGDHKEFRAGIEVFGQHIADAERALGVLVERGPLKRGVHRHRALPHEALQRWLGWDKTPAERLGQVAELLGPRTTLSGEPLPARFPAIAAAFHGRLLSLLQVEAILLEFDTAAGRRAEKDPLINFGQAEHDFVADTQIYAMGPNALRKRAREYIELLDQNGAGADERNPQVNQLRLHRKRDGSGGKMIGDFNTSNFATIATAVAALAVKLAEDDRTLPRRQADALGELASFAPHHDAELPDIGGEVPQIHVVITLDELEARGRARLLDYNERLAPAELRRLLCDCQVIPHILGGAGQTLDIGRASRKIPKHLRRAVAIRDRGGAFPGCTRKPAHCQVHHMKPWADGGKTRLNNLTLLCLYHHRMIHEGDWHVRMGKHRPEFIGPQWADSSKVPKQNPPPLDYAHPYAVG